MARLIAHSTFPVASVKQEAQDDLKRGSSFWHLSSTKLGRWAVGLGAAVIVMYLIYYALPKRVDWMAIPGFFILSCGPAVGIVGLVAVIRKHERSWLVWLIILLFFLPVCMLILIFMGLGETNLI